MTAELMDHQRAGRRAGDNRTTEAVPTRYIDDGPMLLRVPGVRPEVMRAFRLHLGSPFLVFFPAALFDQVAVLEIAAAVDATGRFETNFTDRGLRSGLSGIGSVLGNAQQRAESARWLKQMHLDVHGTGTGHYSDVRYSALTPHLWTWIANSTNRLVLVSFPLCTGITPTAAEWEAMYQFQRHLVKDLELRGSSGKLPATWPDFQAEYEKTAKARVVSSPFLREQYAGLHQLPLPSLVLPRPVRVALTPPWLLIRGYGGHLIKVCSYKAMHPVVAEAVGYRPSRVAELEFRAVLATMHVLWRTLPERLRTDPLTYERLKLEQMEFDGETGQHYIRRKRRLDRRIAKLIRFGEKYQLDTFAVPESRRGRCPVG